MKNLLIIIIACLSFLKGVGQEKKDDGYIILSKIDSNFDTKSNKSNTLTKFKFTYEGNIKYEIPKGIYSLILSSDPKRKSYKIHLINLDTKKIHKIYRTSRQKPNIPPKTSCEEQERIQWDNFRRNTLPSLQRVANQNCYSINYCLTIYCDGYPTVSYFMIIPPNSYKCTMNESIESYRNKYSFGIN